MKPIFALLCYCLIVMRCAGGAPDSLVGFVYYESGGTLARTSYRYAYALNAGGVFQGLYRSSSGIATGLQALLGPEDGSWSYRKIDDASGELTLRSASGSSPGAGKLTLVFNNDSEGYVLASSLPSGVVSALFRIGRASARPPLLNCSNRSFVRAGGSAFTGFVIASGGSGVVLVRAAGPSLAMFGVTDALRNPRITVVNAASNSEVSANDDWPTDFYGGGSALGRADAIRRTSAFVGAFPLRENSKDAALILHLAPGAYVAQVNSPETEDSGQVLIEVYILP